MRSENKKTLEKALHLLDRIGFERKNVMVTGSIALDIMGILPKGRLCHDADFIIKMDEKTWRMTKLLEEVANFNDDSGDIYPSNSEMVCIKTRSGLTLNIWRCDSFDSTMRDGDTGIRIADFRHIINAKKSYGRKKDLIDINSICKELLS